MAYTINDAINQGRRNAQAINGTVVSTGRQVINDGRRNAKAISDVTVATGRQVINDNRRAHQATQDVVVSTGREAMNDGRRNARANADVTVATGRRVADHVNQHSDENTNRILGALGGHTAAFEVVLFIISAAIGIGVFYLLTQFWGRDQLMVDAVGNLLSKTEFVPYAWPLRAVVAVLCGLAAFLAGQSLPLGRKS